MNELSMMDAIAYEEIEEVHGQSRRQEQRFEAALAFTVAACDRKGMASDHNIRYAVLQADRLFVHMDKSKDDLERGGRDGR